MMSCDGTPKIGHNSNRGVDIDRTAQELSLAEVWRAEFLCMHAGQNSTKKQKIDAYAVIDPNVSDAEYRLLRFREYFLNDDCDNYWVSTEREASMLNRSAAAIERASKGLEGSYQTSKRRRNQSSLRWFSVPERNLVVARELISLLETANLRLLDPANLRVVTHSEPSDLRVNVPPEAADLRFQTSEPANLQSRTRKSEGLTLLKNSMAVVEEVNTLRAYSCSSDKPQPAKEALPSAKQLQTWFETSKRWGCSPDVRNPTFVHRWKTDADLREAVAVLGKEFSPATVEAALFATLAEMEARTFDALSPKSKIGAGPCLAYFNRAFPGKLSEFRKREHDDRVNATAVEAQAELRVRGTADRTAAYGQAMRKRIDAPAEQTQTGLQSASGHSDYTKRFNDAWAAFPEHTCMSKLAAFQSWRQHGCEAVAGVVIAGVEAYAKSFTEDRRRNADARVKHMHGWLNERRWESYEVATEESDEKKIKAISLDLVRENPEFISKYGWLNLDEVRRGVPKLWNAALDYARREFTAPDTVKILASYQYVS